MLGLRWLCAMLFFCALALPFEVNAAPFCDCCCRAAGGTGPICGGCDPDGNSLVTINEVTSLGCATNPICLALFATPTTTPTQQPAACVGDCSGDGQVTINELLTMVNIALTLAPVTNCTVGDANMDGSITISELLTAVIRALRGCAVATPIATATSTSANPGASATATASASATAPVPTMTPSAPATATRTPLPPTATRTPLLPSATSTRTPPATPTTGSTGTRSATATATRSTSATATRSASATPSPSRTASPTATAGATAKPCAAVAESAAGGAVIIANGMGVIPSVIASVVSGVKFGNSGIAPGGSAGMCPRGGTATKTGSLPGTMLITLSGCTLAIADGVLVVDGTVSLSGFPILTLNANLQFVNKDGTGTTTRLTSSATLMGSVAPTLGGSCFLTAANLQLASGTLNSHVPGNAGTTVTFNNTSVAMSVATFNADCVPVSYSLTFNGGATLALSPNTLTTLAAASIPVTFNTFIVSQNATTMQTSMNGTVTAACFGGSVSVATRAPLTQAVGVLCPTGGTLRVTATTAADVLYLPGSAVGIDTNLDGISEETFPSCVDARLTACQTECGAVPTATRTPIATTTGFATSTASPIATPTTPSGVSSPNATATRTVSPTPTATSAASVAMYCDTLSQPAIIPDNVLAGINNTISVPDNVVIGDLDVRVAISHSYVGDLRVRLTHVDTGTSIRLADPPVTCSQSDIMAWFDDEAGRVAQNECPNSPPAIDGSVRPLDALSSFDGEHSNGTWQLNVADLVAQDTGSLLGWCLIVNSPAPVVTAFTCNGDPECTVIVNDPFGLEFSFVDPTGNATSWRIVAERDDNFTFNVGAGFITPLSGSGTIPVEISPFTCDGGNCRQTEYDYRVIVTDTSGLDSPALRVHIIVPAVGP